MMACEKDPFTVVCWRTSESWEFPKKWLKKYKINQLSLAEYAKRAVTQLRQDTLNTYNFVEWIGETYFTLSPPQTDAKWASATHLWYQPSSKYEHITPTLDTTAYDGDLKQFLVENHRWNGNGREILGDMKQVENIFNGKKIEQRQLKGFHKNYPVLHDLNNFYPSSTHPLGGRIAWFRLQNRIDMIRCYFEEKGCPFFLADEGGKYTWEENGINRGAKATVLWVLLRRS